MSVRIACAAWLAAPLLLLGSAAAQRHDHDHDHDHGDPSALLGWNLAEGWLDPWPHRHFSPRGTPYTHLFQTEPAFLDRDLFLDYGIANTADGREMELGVELEWALTRRIGLVLEAPIAFLDPDAGQRERGFGDLAVAPRVLAVETDRFLLSANLEVETATGDADRGLGRGEVALSPTLTWWHDLGGWFAWSGQIGTEHGLETGEDELVYHAGLTFSHLAFACDAASDPELLHFPAGMSTLIAEFTGRTGLSGAERGRSTAELLLGTSYVLGARFEVRAGFQFPLFHPNELDSRLILGLIYHF